MSRTRARIETAFERLVKKADFVPREHQSQLAHFLCDLIEGKQSGAVEAPTGLGKSLAALVPAIAACLEQDRRVVIATYTNILAEQYWNKDLPLALSLFDGAEDLAVQFLIGRQRYACLVAMDEHLPNQVDAFRASAELGIESEFRRYVRLPGTPAGAAWQKVAVPPVCPARLCPAFDECFYYSARRKAEKAKLIITNHSVVIQHGLMVSKDAESEGLLGPYDFLILDEAHDFVQAAMNGLEFELSVGKLNQAAGIAQRLTAVVQPLAVSFGKGYEWTALATAFKDDVDRCAADLQAYSLALQRTGILTASPHELLTHPQIEAARSKDGLAGAEAIAAKLHTACLGFTQSLQAYLEEWKDRRPDAVRIANDTIRNYVQFIRDLGEGAIQVIQPDGVSVSYVGNGTGGAMLRQDLVGLSEPLENLIWSKSPYALLSATLAVDGEFEFLKRTTGAHPDFEEILPSPFDFGPQAAVYMPRTGRIPDPTLARREGTEEAYYDALADVLHEIILACEGRTLALFHSRREMEAVHARMNLPPELPILVQARSGVSTVGDRFRVNVHSSLFALRSFWTGFDAPGETLSCVALTRVPFEVPVEPPALARLAYLQQQGYNPFAAWTLPMAKMMIRQGAGRLIRTSEDRGVIAMLDPRLRIKRYGEEIIANLPAEMRTFDEIADAVGWIGLGSSLNLEPL